MTPDYDNGYESADCSPSLTSVPLCAAAVVVAIMALCFLCAGPVVGRRCRCQVKSRRVVSHCLPTQAAKPKPTALTTLCHVHKRTDNAIGIVAAILSLSRPHSLLSPKAVIRCCPSLPAAGHVQLIIIIVALLNIIIGCNLTFCYFNLQLQLQNLKS